MKNYSLQDTQKIIGSRPNTNLKRSIGKWRNQLEDFVRVIIKGDKLDLFQDGLSNPKINFKEPNPPVINRSSDTSLVETQQFIPRQDPTPRVISRSSNSSSVESQQFIPRQVHSHPQEKFSNLQEADAKSVIDHMKDKPPLLNKATKKKLGRNSAFVSLNRTYGSVEAREILHELDDLLKDLKSGTATVSGRG